MKKALSVIIAAAVLLCLAACTAGIGHGKKLDQSITRVYTPGTRESLIVKNGVLIDGSVTGKLYFTTSADGSGALGRVDNVLYFIDDNGSVLLSSGASEAEISLDGKLALYYADGTIHMYSREKRADEVVDTGITSVCQFALSPHSECVMFTAVYEDSPETYRTKLYKNGELTTVIEESGTIVLAVSDDACRYWCSDMSGSLTVYDGGRMKTVSSELDASSNCNFTIGLDEVTFTTGDDTQYYYRLADDRLIKLGTGFGYTLKTDIFSISEISRYCYVNDIDTFSNGLFIFERTVSDGAVYSVGRIGRDGNFTMLLENAFKYFVASDASKVFWLGPDGLFETAARSGKTKLVAKDVLDFGVTSDSLTVYYLTGSGTLYKKAGASAKKLDSDVTQLAVFREGCAYIKDAPSEKDALYTTDGGDPVKITDFAEIIDEFRGQLILYSDPAYDGDRMLYKAWVSTDGLSFKKIADGAEP